ncbi:non-homologous end joining protein Ku [Marinoscillum furvescens]|uniref:Non-homologous end joining protein Ku n=1 Tax=Marinoscillum furvescens DSM 4134 TaxID=1122208 RepID=A0A3D9KYU3_MARFU|nr:Ku protein [Marinoscillum furvescens]RED93897.1 Ku protein [Marinoscillum furvescens DSM 4134]
MRAIWKGHIRFSLVTIPIRIYNAIDNQQAIRFNLLSKENHNPVKYEKKDKVTGETLRAEDIVKGYQYEPDQFVIITSEDFDKVKLQSTKVIEIEGFVDASEVHPTLFDAPYFAGPDGDVAAKTYRLLSEALLKSGKVGVGKVVLRDRENVVLLTPHEGGILLYKLRYRDEVRSITQVPKMDTDSEIDADQLKMASTLIDSMTRSFEDMELKDRYNGALKEMIMSKIEGKEVVSVTEEEPEVVDIMTALKESIAQAKADKKPMKKAKKKSKASEKKQQKAS